MATTVRLKTYDDLCRMPEDGNRYELIGGAIVVSPAPTWLHQIVITRLVGWLYDFVEAGDLGWVAPAPLDIYLFPHDIVQPDIVYVSMDRAAIRTSNGTNGAPDLVVEVLSPTTRYRDEGNKLALYARARVLEYWMVDLEARQFRPLTLTLDGYRPIPLDGSTFRSVVLPGFAFGVNALFANLD